MHGYEIANTQAWRRMNKKGKVDESGKKRTRKAQKFQKAIVGMSSLSP